MPSAAPDAAITATHPPSHVQTSSHEVFGKPVGIIVPLRRHANQRHTDLPEQPIDEGIAGETLREFVGGVIEFDGRHDSRRFGPIDDEVDVLLANAIGLPALPFVISTRDDIGKANLARDLIAIGDDQVQNTKERCFIFRQQIVSGPIKDRRWLPAPVAPSFA